MLRAIFVIAIIAYGCAKSVKGPFYALLFYLWIAYFRPEYWLWSDFFSQLNLSFIVGVLVLFTTLLSPSEKLRFGLGPVLITAFVAQGLLATLVSPEFIYTWPYWQDFAKTGIISILIVTLASDERRFRLVFAVIAFSLGLEAVKQGWFQLILNPGATNNNEYAMLGDNNAVAVGMLMLTSILVALARTATTRGERYLDRFAAIGVVYRALSTYSRGGFLSCGILALHYLARSKRKFVGAMAIAVVCAVVIPVLPDAFWERMGTINSAREDLEEADASIRGRVHFWNVAWQMALDRPLIGVGVNGFNASYPKYDASDEFGGNRSVHSSWFGVLSELGFPGLILFVALLCRGFWLCARTQRLAKKHPELENLGKYANALEGALLVFCVGGSFVIFHYNELIWHVMALTFALDNIVTARLGVLETKGPAPIVERPLVPAAAMAGHFVVPAPVRAANRARGA